MPFALGGFSLSSSAGGANGGMDAPRKSSWRHTHGLSIIVEEDAFAAQRLLSSAEMGEAPAALAAQASDKGVCFCSDHPYHELRGKAHTHVPRKSAIGVLPVILYLCCMFLALLLIHSLASTTPSSNAVSEAPPSAVWNAVDATHSWVADTLYLICDTFTMIGNFLSAHAPF